MDIIYLVFFFLFGTIIGSFLNFVILRYNTGRLWGKHSGCFSCGKRLYWYELIPLFSYIAQGGKCTKCGSRISWQYPLVEYTTGVIFLLLGIYFKPLILALPMQGMVAFIYYAIAFSLLVVISGYDIRHTIIPDRLVASLSLIALFVPFVPALAMFAPTTVWFSHILGALILATPFFILWLVSKGKWMGLGDAKLAGAIGLLLGVSGGVVALLFSFWIGAIVGVVLLLLKNRGFTMKSEIPFGPFLAIGAFLVFIFHLNLLSLVTFFHF
jgi:prepilin signal peptidase PulO-like enzyme (type II secretory pathway)